MSHPVPPLRCPAGAARPAVTCALFAQALWARSAWAGLLAVAVPLLEQELGGLEERERLRAEACEAMARVVTPEVA